jgi:TonB-linked SusC/RagA family outer membrane protein
MRKLLVLLAAFLFCAGGLLAQKVVTGTVTDDRGNPIPNASVTVKGTTTGTVTRFDGTYSLTVPSTAQTLIFSSVDMTPVEIAIGTQTAINASLKLEDKVMQEVVMVGYGTQKKREATAAIGKIDPTTIAPLISPSIDKQLGGRTAGVMVTNPSGLVNEPPRIRIRGVNSINGGRGPLIVLDGVPTFSGGFAGFTNDNLLANINPADVESIDVLKDGSATAIYGSQAANGVIMITTKKGKAGRMNFNYSAVFGFAKPAQRFELLNAQQFVTIANEKLTNAGLAAAAFMNSENTNTDWQDVVFNNVARSYNHNLSLDGGNDRTTYYLSFNYRFQQGLIITNNTENYNIRANIEHKINKWLKVSNYITLARAFDKDQNNGGNALSGGIAGALRALPNVRAMNPNLPQFDFYNVTPDGAALGQDANTRIIENNYTNQAFVLNKNKFRSKKHRVIDNFSIDIKPVSWLTNTFKVGIDYITLDEFLSYDARHGDGRSSGGRVSNQAANTLGWALQDYINANKSFGGHNFNLTIGTEARSQESNSFTASGTQLADPFFQLQNVISNSYGTQTSSGGYSQGPGLVSYFARLNYDFGGKYFIQASFRRDGLSKFSKDNRFGNFPGASVGYRVSKENFWNDANLDNIFNDFKIRASWGKVGNTNIVGGSFPYLSLYASAPYGATSGIAASQAGNSNLQWETNEKIDFGVDMALWQNRINLVVDYFKNKNNNLVLAVPQPPSFGVPQNQIYQNIGSMENKGFEVQLDVAIIKQKDFSFDLGVNFTHQTNKVLSLYLDQDVVISNGTGNYNVLRVGQPINAIYGYNFVGVSSANGNPVYRKADGSLLMGNIPNSSYYAVTDPNSGTLGAAGTLAGTDRAILGNVLPKYFGGVTGTFRYKQFSLDMLWRYLGGNKIMNITRQESLLNQGFMNNGVEILERWTKVGDVTGVPKLWYGRDNFTNLNQQALSRFVENGSFIKLDNLALSYEVSPVLLNRVTKSNVKSFRLFVQGQNLLTITDYTGIDPDNIDERGLDYNTVPPARTISLGLSIGF